MNALSLAELGDVLPAVGKADETFPMSFFGAFLTARAFSRQPSHTHPRTPNHSLCIYPGGLP